MIIIYRMMMIRHDIRININLIGKRNINPIISFIFPIKSSLGTSNASTVDVCILIPQKFI